jgi:glycosyltransferase involved in cell wall biosynthesis
VIDITADKGTGMIYLGMSPWTGMWKNRHHLMSRFAEAMPVLYVEPWQGLRKVRRALLSGAGREALQWSTWRERSPNLYIFQSPAHLPVSGSGLLGSFTQRRWYSGIRRVASDAGIRRPILWISRPELAGALGRFDECLSIYHVVDEYGGYTSHDDVTRKALWKAEEALLDRVDMSIVVSRELLKRKSAPNREVFLVENAVDIEKYDARRKSSNVPDDLATIARPRLGYSGLIGSRLDLGLLRNLARARPDWSIVLIGKVDSRGCEEDIAALNRLTNVHFLGEKPYSEIPGYVLGFDVGLLPYRINLETRNISPLKMYEYLAAGVPVVSTDIPAVEDCKDIVDVRNNAQEFEDACAFRLGEDSSEEVGKRVAFARCNTWESRVEQLWQIISPRLNQDAPARAGR